MTYVLKVVGPSNRVDVLELEAADEQDARSTAALRGYAVLGLRRRGLPIRLRGRPAFPTVVFTHQLLALLQAGLNVVEALQTLFEKEASGTQRAVLSSLLESVRRGESLSDGIGRLPDAFPPLYRATVRSSERTGNLREALARYVAYRDAFDRVRRKAVAALLYPAVLSAVGVLVLCFLMLYVVPRFASVYADLSAELPLFSSLLLGLGAGIDRHGPAIAAVLVAAGIAAVRGAFHPATRAWALHRAWSAPILGARLKVFQLARFYRTFGMLLQAGIPAASALEMVAALLPGRMRAQLQEARARLQEGVALSACLTGAGLATPVATRLLAVGERSGRMGELMDHIAGFYDDETSRFVDTFTRVLEPALMALLGVAVGLVVVLMYMPIFELAGAVR